MNIHEYQAAEILGRYGIPLNAGQAATTPDEAAAAARALGGTVAIKAQVHSGGRGKAGGIKLATSPDEAREVAGRILGMDIRGHTVNTVFVVPGVSIAAEYYVGITLDRANRQIIVMASAEGGVEIEEVARTNPDAILRVPVDPVRGLLNYRAVDLAFALGIEPAAVGGFVEIVTNMARAYLDEDASLVEINPLIRTDDGRWLALDSKMVLDDNALFRHPSHETLRDMAEENATELTAKASGISFVKLDGDVGCVVNGAGLAMATMDALQVEGGAPANFLDVGGGANAAQVAKALSLILADPHVKAIFFNIFGGITRGDEVAKGLLAGLEQVPTQLPIIVRLAGVNAEEGRRILATAHMQSAETMEEAARLAVAAAKGEAA
ncbi:MAG: ADP-forming succinate--CoA ligase subunit beta [Thermomicrobiales bacterium]